MLDFSKNKSELIKRVLAEASDQEFEYEASEIIQSLMETDLPQVAFKSRKLEESAFFSNSHNYIKRVGKKDDK
jgi:hypothetical protein